MGPRLGRRSSRTSGQASTVRTPTDLTAVGDKVFFQARLPEEGGGLWKTDGTEQGTILFGEGAFAIPDDPG